jgi:hypothetical protein
MTKRLSTGRGHDVQGPAARKLEAAVEEGEEAGR